MNKSEFEQHKPTHWDILKAAIQIQGDYPIICVNLLRGVE